MPPRKRTWSVCRDDDSDDANDVNLAHARTIHISKDQRRVVAMPRSPQKARAGKSSSRLDLWQPSADFDQDFEYEQGEVDGGSAEDVVVVSAKRYPRSMSFYSRS